ncbi:MAG TPA: sortase [Candidatus Paceibacterota bacterium]|nr:sortase [Candidatus Paceibacterota bacterium]
MVSVIRIVARLIRAGKRAYGRKWSFLVISVFVFGAGVAVLARLDLLPDPAAPAAPAVALSSDVLVAAGTRAPAPAAGAEFPVKISIPSIALSAAIANPDTTNIDALDQLLLKGAVRYPTSAELGEPGNVVLFGHSSYLPIVLNQAYKTFDGIQKLESGDSIEVDSADMAYVYAVVSMTKESANDAAIPLSVTGRVLTLSTCDSFASKSDRFVVVADFVESHPIPG